MFTSDRDLLLLDPTLFRDVGWLGQRLLSTVATVIDTTLTVSGVDLTALGVAAGHVVLVDGAALEVTQRLSPTALEISRPRAAPNDPPIPASFGVNRAIVIHTFSPQLAIAHGQILRMLGLEADAAPVPGTLTDANVTNPRSLWLVEALCALYQIYAAAAALAPADSPAHVRAEHYRARFNAERQRATARIDTDGDGRADVTRYLNVVQFLRA